MLHYAVVFLVVALIAAVLGFGGIAQEAADAAKLLFLAFASLSAGAFLAGWKKHRSQAPADPTTEEPI